MAGEQVRWQDSLEGNNTYPYFVSEVVELVLEVFVIETLLSKASLHINLASESLELFDNDADGCKGLAVDIKEAFTV